MGIVHGMYRTVAEGVDVAFTAASGFGIGYLSGLIAKSNPVKFGQVLAISEVAQRVFEKAFLYAGKACSWKKSSVVCLKAVSGAAISTVAILALYSLRLIGPVGVTILGVLSSVGFLKTMDKAAKYEQAGF